MGKLNADAPPFIPTSQGGGRAVAEDDRSLFMTFSNGSSFTWKEISHHFNSKYGNGCVEYVYVHTRQGGEADFGKIIFRHFEMANMIMRNEEVVKEFVNGKHLWLKKYVPPTRRNTSNDEN